MTWTNPPVTENRVTASAASGDEKVTAAALEAESKSHPIRVGKTHVYEGAELFTLSMGAETIELVPLKSWPQLDRFKWTVRGKLPGTPAGLEVTPDHIKLAGETVWVHDPQGCSKLEKVFGDWLAFETGVLELAKKTRPNPSARMQHPSSAGTPVLRFQVETDKRGQIHVHSWQGPQLAATIGLTAAGFTGLCHQGLMRQPKSLHVGALHDWVELDGERFVFKEGHHDAARLEALLNERYLPAAALGQGKQVVVFENAASATGFDLQFHASVGGVVDVHRMHLNEESLGLLQDPERCGLLHPEIIVKLIPPTLVFKQKTAEGGEDYLSKVAKNLLHFMQDDGKERIIDLAQPLNLLRLNAPELIAIFNHLSINQHARIEPQPDVPTEPRPVVVSAPVALKTQEHSPAPSIVRQAAPEITVESSTSVPVSAPVGQGSIESQAQTGGQSETITTLPSPSAIRPLPNLWVKSLLLKPQLEPNWFACLAYSKMAVRFGNSTEGKFGPWRCWFISLGEVEDIDHPSFKGIFLTERGGLGFLSRGQMARFSHDVAFIGPHDAPIEGVGISLLGIGMDSRKNVVFILNDGYELKFGISNDLVANVLAQLRESGTVLIGEHHVVASSAPLEVVWTVPAEQTNMQEPEALESTPEGSGQKS